MPETSEPAWVARALELPLFFAQVREDALQDVTLVRGLEPGARALIVSSGGCTAAALAAEENLARLTLIDPNPAQLALTRLKLHLLTTRAPEARAALLGHAAHPQRGPALTAALAEIGLAADALGPAERVAALGPDQAGRYERLFAELRAALDRAGQTEALTEVLATPDAAERARRVAVGAPLGEALAAAFREVFALPILVRLFGEGATSNRVVPFDEHFTAKTRDVLSGPLALENPYLEHVLLGPYPAKTPAPWLSIPRLDPHRLPEVVTVNLLMNDALRAEEQRYDLIGLSNILDWLSPTEATETLALAHARLKPGGRVVVRQLNSTLDVAAAGPQLTWETGEAAQLHATDRSYFYRALHLGRRADGP